MMDLESHRVLTRGGQSRGVVYTYLSGRLVFRRWTGPYSCTDLFFDSIDDLKKVLRKKRWKLEKVNWFK